MVLFIDFQNHALPWIMSHYERLLRWALNGWKPVYFITCDIWGFHSQHFYFLAAL